MSSLVLIIALAFFLGYLVGNLMRSVAFASHRRSRRLHARSGGTQISPS